LTDPDANQGRVVAKGNAAEPVHVRCADGRPCVEVLDRLHAVDVARANGIDNEPAVQQLLDWSRRHAEAHGYGRTDRSEP
jgi:hypothetical protein